MPSTSATEFATATVGIATAQAGRPVNADAAAQHRFPDEDGVLLVAVVDGTGSTPEVATAAYLAAECAVRIGARDGVREGVLVAARMLANPFQDFPDPDCVIIVAEVPPGDPTRLDYAGDCDGFGFDGTELRQLTVPHTHGQRLRDAGEPEETARQHDHEVYNSVGRATDTTISTATTTDPITVLVSDGVTKALSHNQIADIIAQHADDADACAQALVNTAVAARPRGDNVTAAVIVRHRRPRTTDTVVPDTP